MAMNRSPIPIPTHLRLRHFCQTRLPIIMFVVSLLLLLWMWERRMPQVAAVGQVESMTVSVQSEFGGVLQPLESHLQSFDPVVKDVSVVARVSVERQVMELQTAMAERERLVAELVAKRESLRLEQVALNQQHDKTLREVQDRQLSLGRSEADARQAIDDMRREISDLDQRQSEIMVKLNESETAVSVLRIELQNARTKVNRLANQVRMKMAPAYRLNEVTSELQLCESTLRQNLKLQSTLASQASQIQTEHLQAQQRLQETREALQCLIDRRAMPGPELPDSSLTLVTSRRPVLDQDTSLQPLVKAIAVQDATIAALAKQIERQEIRSPVTGTVTAVHFPPGSYVPSDQPIMTIASSQSNSIIAYVDQRSSALVAVGDDVKVIVRDRPVEAKATVSDRGTQFESLPIHLRKDSNVPQLGLPIKISLPVELELIPGEIVDLVLSPSA